MQSDADLKRELNAEWQMVVDRIRDANGDLAHRLSQEPVSIFFDADDDTVTIELGRRPALAYTQSVGSIRVDVDEVNDRIAAIVIEEFSAYAARHPAYALHDIGAALKRVGHLELSGASDKRDLSRELQELLTA